MSTINKVILQGRLGIEPQTSRSPRGTFIVKFSLGTRTYVNEQALTTWHRIVGFGTRAQEWCSQFKKGDLVRVDGELISRTYKDKNGEMRYITEVKANHMERGVVMNGPDVRVDGRAKAAGPDHPLWPEDA